MQNLNQLHLPALVDLLEEQTNLYMKMQKEVTPEESYSECKKLIQNITAEIEYRKQKDKSITHLKDSGAN